MVPIKIQCGCGQKYAFEVEPVSGQMPWEVSCPSCGADGTGAANNILAQSVAAAPAAVPAPTTTSSLRIAGGASAQQASVTAGPAVAMRRSEAYTGQVDRTQATMEAKAKVSWGDPPNVVITYLMSQGFSHGEASALVKGMFDERAITIRKNGFKKIFCGIGLVCVPIITLIGFLAIGFIEMKVFAVTVMVGVYGLYMIMKGIFMIIAPRHEGGDVAEQ